MQFTVYSVSYTSPQLQTEGGGIPWAEGASQAPEEGGQPYRTVQGYWCTWCTEYSSTITLPWPDYTWARGKGGKSPVNSPTTLGLGESQLTRSSAVGGLGHQRRLDRSQPNCLDFF